MMNGKNNKYFDIADELFTQKNVEKYAEIRKVVKKNLMISETIILSNRNPYGKEKGVYCSFNFDRLDDEKTYARLVRCLKRYLKDFIFQMTGKEDPSILFVGLGNESYTPDSLGPSVVKNLHSNYFYRKKIGCLIPGVMALTGMETSDIVKGVLKCHDYDLVIVIDSLATSSIRRLNKTIQITDTGISPGSGVNNFRKAINFRELKVKVLTIGIATVISYEKLIGEFVRENKIEFSKPLDLSLVMTTKEIEHELSYLSLLLSEVLNSIIGL